MNRAESVPHVVRTDLTPFPSALPVGRQRREDTQMTTTTPRNPRPEAGSDLYVEVWGDGTPVVLVHGSLAPAPTSGPRSDRSPMRASS
jgi:hypothetical protein